MDLDYSSEGSVKAPITNYTGKILIAFPEHIVGSAASPSAEDLFKVRYEKEAKYLPEEHARSFHHTTAHMLFMCSQERRDTKTEVALPSTIIKQPDDYEWGKLNRLLKYLNGTRNMRLNLTVGNMSLIKWWVDASYNVHWDSRGHNGSMVSLGRWAIISNSNKKKLNINISTEGELGATQA